MIKITDLYKIYDTGKVKVAALRGVSLEVIEGEFVAIMGPSGSGKSTLMNILGCLDRPTRGSYTLAGQEVADKTDNELAEIRNRRIGFIFQTFNLLPRLNAIQNVELPLIYRGTPPRERRRLAQEALVAVGLGDRMHHKPKELSGGQQQRVAIARALAAQPAILLADEPTGNLDSRTGEEIMAVFQDLNRQGKTILLVTHDQRIAEHCQRIIHLRDGVIIKDEKVAKPIEAREELARLPSLEVAVPV